MTVEPVTIHVPEYRSVDVSLTDAQARQLQLASGSRLTISPARSGFRLTASSHVGSISIPGLIVHVTPKVPVENVLRLMTWSTRRVSFLDPSLGHASASLTPAVAAWYARMLERTLVLGPDRAYVEQAERLDALRGRVDLPAFAHTGGLPTPLPCRFDEWTVDTRLNRLVTSAAHALARQPGVPAHTAMDLRRLMRTIPGVGALRPDDLTATAPLTNRLNDHYADTAQLAILILRSSGFGHGAGSTVTSSFMVDMNKVFEDFVSARVAALLTDGRRLTCQRPVPLDEERFVITAPDLIVTNHRGRTELVADVKYKLTTDGTGRSSDYYQLLAYCTSLALPRGVLIYADPGDLPAPPRRLHVRNGGTILDTVRLSLHGSPEELDAHVGAMVTGLLQVHGPFRWPSPLIAFPH